MIVIVWYLEKITLHFKILNCLLSARFLILIVILILIHFLIAVIDNLVPKFLN